MLNRAKKNARANNDDDSLSKAPKSEPSGLSSLDTSTSSNNDFSGWAPSKRSSTGVFVSAADEIQNWISRSLLSKNEEDKQPLQAVIDEFLSDEEMLQIRGGAVGDLRTGPSSWVKQDPNRDIDPSGVMAAAVENMKKAAEMNISYVQYVDRFVKPSRAPTVETVQPNRRQLPDDASYQLVTAPFRYPVYSLLPRVPYCTCWYGIFFEVEAIDHDVEITGLFSQSGEYWADLQDTSNYTVYCHAGAAEGAECSKEGWELLGSEHNVRLPRANFTSSSSPIYGRLPLNHFNASHARCGPGGGMVLKAGERRGYMVLSSSARGVALRAKHQDAWQAGEESERDEHLIIRTGLLPCRWQDLSTTALHHVYHPQNAAAFVGIVDYRVLD